MPATHTYDPATIQSAWSHRSAAAIANLGYFSANRMLVSEKGSAGRYCTVFTSARLESRHEAPVNQCPYLKNGGCHKCFDACPIGALRPSGLDSFACQERLQRNMADIYTSERDSPRPTSAANAFRYARSPTVSKPVSA